MREERSETGRQNLNPLSDGRRAGDVAYAGLLTEIQTDIRTRNPIHAAMIRKTIL